MRLTAALAKFLGMDVADGAQLVPRTVAYGAKAATLKAIEEGRRMALTQAPRQYNSWCVMGHPLDVSCDVMIGG